LITFAVKERVGANQQRAGARLGHGRERHVDVACGTRAKDAHLLPEGASGILNTPQLSLKIRIGWVEQYRYQRGSRNQPAKERQSLSLQHLLKDVHPGCIAARPVEGQYQAGCDRIGTTYEDNWNRCGCRVGGKCRGAASRRNDHGHTPADNVSGQRYKSIRLTIRRAEINRHIPALDVTGVFQGLAECRHQVKIKGLAVEKTDHRHCRLLRARHKWPRNRTTEKCNEFPAPHVHRLLRKTISHAGTMGLVQRNVATLVKPPKAEDVEITILTKEQIAKLLTHVKGRTIYLILVLGLATGARRGELLASALRTSTPRTAPSVLSIIGTDQRSAPLQGP
jgi:hypothetical protein